MDVEEEFLCSCQICNDKFEKLSIEINRINSNHETLRKDVERLMHILNIQITEIMIEINTIKTGSKPEVTILKNHF